MSIADFFFAAPYIFTTWAMPRHIANLYQPRGSFATCTIQGASLQLGVQTSPLFHLAFSLCSLLMIRYNWSAQRMRRFELTLQCVIWLYGLVVTVPFIFYRLYNPTSTSCWIASYPHRCEISTDDEIDCVRGESAATFYAIFAFWPTWPCIILGIFNMMAIYWTVRNLETRNQRYAGRSSFIAITNTVAAATAPDTNHVPLPSTVLSHHHTHVANRLRSRAVAIQALCYTAAFILTFSLDTIVLLWDSIELEANHILVVAAYVLFPLQGFFNLLVYARTSEMHTREGRFVKWLICCCGCCCGQLLAGRDRRRSPAGSSRSSQQTVMIHRPQVNDRKEEAQRSQSATKEEDEFTDTRRDDEDEEEAYTTARADHVTFEARSVEVDDDGNEEDDGKMTRSDESIVVAA
jgi:hypothetical protein